jgi:hypothetical protein
MIMRRGKAPKRPSHLAASTTKPIEPQQNRLLSSAFLRVSDGTRTHDRLDHNQATFGGEISLVAGAFSALRPS